LTPTARCGRFDLDLGCPRARLRVGVARGNAWEGKGWNAKRERKGWNAGFLFYAHTNDVEDCMKEWHKPEVMEQDVGMEVTSYLPAELDKA